MAEKVIKKGRHGMLFLSESLSGECPVHQGCSGLLWGCFGLKNKRKQNDFTILRNIEVEAGREGEGRTRIN